MIDLRAVHLLSDLVASAPHCERGEEGREEDDERKSCDEDGLIAFLVAEQVRIRDYESKNGKNAADEPTDYLNQNKHLSAPLVRGQWLTGVESKGKKAAHGFRAPGMVGLGGAPRVECVELLALKAQANLLAINAGAASSFSRRVIY